MIHNQNGPYPFRRIFYRTEPSPARFDTADGLPVLSDGVSVTISVTRFDGTITMKVFALGWVVTWADRMMVFYPELKKQNTEHPT